jgi:hypothetical protein
MYGLRCLPTLDIMASLGNVRQRLIAGSACVVDITEYRVLRCAHAVILFMRLIYDVMWCERSVWPCVPVVRQTVLKLIYRSLERVADPTHGRAGLRTLPLHGQARPPRRGHTAMQLLYNSLGATGTEYWGLRPWWPRLCYDYPVPEGRTVERAGRRWRVYRRTRGG